jgi:AGCS family alanine or glycine:cation symporter
MDILSYITGGSAKTALAMPVMLLILFSGLYLSKKTDYIQFKKFGYVMRSILGTLCHRKKAGTGTVTSFQAVTTSLAATIGTGNIAGVSGAIAIGGPGAVFWMWVSALFGMAVKYSEILLAVRFRERNAKGEWVGGPMYYIKNGLGGAWLNLAAAFALIGALSAFGGGNIAQSNTIANSVYYTLVSFSPGISQFKETIVLAVGIILAVLVGAVVIGGMTRVGRVTAFLVPFMGAAYVILASAVVLSNVEALPHVIKEIFISAFDPSAAVGGISGITISSALRAGVGRGVFSNEAGIGSAPIAHAAADTRDPVRQGLFGVFEVFVDTIVICSLTAFAVLVSGIDIAWGEEAGAGLTISAFSSVFGGKAAGTVIALCVFMFAVSTMISWSLYGARCMEYLFGEKSSGIYRVIFVLVTVGGATLDLGLAWGIVDTLNLLMAVPNLIALLALSGVVAKLTKRHFEGSR